jgi:hypothetical protein
MRTSTAYFVGAGTVIVAIVAGLGGGLLIANMVSPKPAKQGTELTRLEQRMSREPIQASAKPSEPVQYLAAPSLLAPSSADAAAPVQAAPPTDTSNSTPAAVPPAAVAAAQPAPPAAEPATPVAQEPRRAASGDAFAKAQEADIKRAAEVKRMVEKRKLERERRQQWADKRQPRQAQELREVEEKVREETEPRRQSAIEPVRIEMPRIGLFGQQ